MYIITSANSAVSHSKHDAKAVGMLYRGVHPPRRFKTSYTSPIKQDFNVKVRGHTPVLGDCLTHQRASARTRRSENQSMRTFGKQADKVGAAEATCPLMRARARAGEQLGSICLKCFAIWVQNISMRRIIEVVILNHTSIVSSR